MSLRVVFRRAAQSEFEDAVDWYETRRRGLGEEFVQEVNDAIENAAGRPQQYPVVLGDVRRTVCRRFPFAIYFRVRGESLVILAVFHGRRDPSVWKRRA
jgi:plasmid stabilization system protein ParE